MVLVRKNHLFNVQSYYKYYIYYGAPVARDVPSAPLFGIESRDICRNGINIMGFSWYQYGKVNLLLQFFATMNWFRQKKHREVFSQCFSKNYLDFIIFLISSLLQSCSLCFQKQRIAHILRHLRQILRRES